MRPLAILALLAAGSAHAAPPIAGRWLTENGKAVVTIGACGPVTCGRIAQVLVPTPGVTPTDRNNPDPKLRSRPVEGLEILSGFTAGGQDWRGRIYDPEAGKWYKSVIAREPGGLKVQGCVMMFCRSQHWKPAR